MQCQHIRVSVQWQYVWVYQPRSTVEVLAVINYFLICQCQHPVVSQPKLQNMQKSQILSKNVKIALLVKIIISLSLSFSLSLCCSLYHVEPIDRTLFCNVKIYLYFICIWCLLNYCWKFYNNNVLQALSYFLTLFNNFKLSMCLNNISNFLPCSSYCYSVSPSFSPDIWILFISNQHYRFLFWPTMDMYNNDYYIAFFKNCTL